MDRDMFDDRRAMRLPALARTSLFIAAIAAALTIGFAAALPPGWAWAESHDGGSHSEGGHDGGEGGHDDGHVEGDDGGHESGGPRGPGGSGGGHEGGDHESGSGGQGAFGEGEGEGRGGDAGGKPVWAQEGIPEVELGRLNVARSPRQVIDRAFNEALASFTPEVAAFYALDLEAMEKELAENWDKVNIIDSPLQNLALLQDALDGESILSAVGITTDNETLLAAFLGTASDKAIPISTDTVTAITTILGYPLSEAEAASLAEKAERIRQSIVEGHG